MDENKKAAPRRQGLPPLSTPPAPQHFEDDDDDYEDDDAPVASPLASRGWGAMSTKIEVTSNARLPELILKSGEETILQFLDDEPVTLLFHTGASDRRQFDQLVCEREAGRKTCIMCENGVKKQPRSIFRVLDTRGTYENERHTYGAAVEKYFECSSRVAEDLHFMLKKRQEKTKNYNLTLLDVMVEVSRTGEGTGTRWNFAVAMDENDKVLVPPKGIKPKLSDPLEAYKPLSPEHLANINVRNKAY
jgi:hypothetical protein